MPPARADMRFALTLLLAGFASALFRFRLREVTLVLAFAFVFGGTTFMQRYRDRLPPALHFAATATTATLQLPMLVLMHDPAN